MPTSPIFNTTAFEAFCDALGQAYLDQLPGIDAPINDLVTLQSNQYVNFGSGSAFDWLSTDAPLVSQIVQMLAGVLTTSSSAFATATGFLGNQSSSGLQSTSNGYWQRRTAVYSGFNTLLKQLKALISTYPPSPGIVGIPTFCSVQSAQVSAAFASLYWWVDQQLLDPSAVFAPTGINLGSFAITGLNTGTLTAGHFATANGYGSPAPTTDGYGNDVYLGGTPMAQGFAPVATVRAQITTNINGTCTLTASFTNQYGVTGRQWTAVIDNATAGTNVNFTAVTGGDLVNSICAAVTISGSATSGAFQLQTVALR